MSFCGLWKETSQVNDGTRHLCFGSPRIRRICLTLFFCTNLGLFADARAEDLVSELLPHRAVYDLTLMPVSNRSEWDSVTGRIVFELSGSVCAGFKQNFREVLVLSGPKSGRRVIDSFTSDSEAGDGRSMEFSASEVEPDGTVQRTSGVAKSTENGGTAHFNSPMQSDIEVDKYTYFPVSYTRNLIHEALVGHHLFSATQFDGTDQLKPIEESFAVLGEAQSGRSGIDSILAGKDFEPLRHWPVTIGYRHSSPKEVSESEYTVFQDLFENGVSQRLMLDFKDFKLSGKLVEFSFLEKIRCSPLN